MNPALSTASSRKPWLDACRALAILFVVYGHQVKSGPAFFAITSPVKVTMFFVISGYLFNGRGGSVRSFFKNLSLKIVLPWLILAIPQNLARELLGSKPADFADMLYGVLSGREFWYMPCCIVSESMFFFILKYSRSRLQTALACILGACAGFLLAKFSLAGFACFNTALICLLYLLLGYLYRCYEERISLHLSGRTGLKLAFGSLSYILLVTLDRLFWSKQALNVHANRYGVIPITLVIILLGCWLLFEITKRLRLPRILCFIGENTLFFYMFEQIFRSITRVILKMLHIAPQNNTLYSLLICIPACAAMCVAALFMNRFLPFAVGKRRR